MLLINLTTMVAVIFFYAHYSSQLLRSIQNLHLRVIVGSFFYVFTFILGITGIFALIKTYTYDKTAFIFKPWFEIMNYLIKYIYV